MHYGIFNCHSLVWIEILVIELIMKVLSLYCICEISVMYKLSSVMQAVNVHICYIAMASLQDDYVYSGVSTGNRFAKQITLF